MMQPMDTRGRSILAAERLERLHQDARPASGLKGQMRLLAAVRRLLRPEAHARGETASPSRQSRSGAPSRAA